MSVETFFRWFLFGAFAVFWFLCAVRNLVDIVNARIQGASTSLILVFGGLAGVIALLVCPIPGTARWALLPAVLDIGCIPAIILIGLALFRERRNTMDGD